MVQSVFSALTLGYRPLWSRARRLVGIQLFVHEDPGCNADMGHFLRSLNEIWSQQAPPLLISAQSRQVLCNLLEHAPQGSPWIEVQGDWLQQDEGIYELVQKAKARGLMLVWGGSLAEVPDADAARCFASSLLSLPRGCERHRQCSEKRNRQAGSRRQGGGRRLFTDQSLSLLGGQMYQGLQSLELCGRA